MVGNKIRFYGEIWLIVPKIFLFSFLFGALHTVHLQHTFQVILQTVETP